MKRSFAVVCVAVVGVAFVATASAQSKIVVQDSVLGDESLGQLGVTFASAAQAGTDVDMAALRKCKNVTVRLKPEGEGGAIDILAKKVGCKKTRRIVKRCIRGKVNSGWKGKWKDPRIVLSSHKNNRRIGFTPVGGGGCVSL